jgi:DNA (cytosine-5)-methyltransferase 1
MERLKVLSLFAGIGGFDLGLERTGGFKTVAFCEIEKFPQRILKKHWPEVPIYNDVRELTAEQLWTDGVCPNVICGGFPCQDLSTAGRLAGIAEGTRSGLWFEFRRLIGELRPRYIIVENVSNLLRGPSEQPGWWFGKLLGDLAELGYDAEWENIPASALGAPHRRERVWLVAYPMQERAGGGSRKMVGQGGNKSGPGYKSALEAKCGGQDVAHANQAGLQGRAQARDAGEVRPRLRQFIERCANDHRAIWETEPAVGRVVDGLPNRAHRIAALGNAILASIREQKEAAA